MWMSEGHADDKLTLVQVRAKLLSGNKTLPEPIDELVQERRNSIANALELHLSCTKPSQR